MELELDRIKQNKKLLNKIFKNQMKRLIVKVLLANFDIRILERINS